MQDEVAALQNDWDDYSQLNAKVAAGKGPVFFRNLKFFARIVRFGILGKEAFPRSQKVLVAQVPEQGGQLGAG